MSAEQELVSAADDEDMVAVKRLLALGSAYTSQAALDHALLAAVHKNSVAIVAILLAHGASPNAMEEGGRTALHVAALGWANDVVGCLIKAGGDPNQRDADGFTPLVYAIRERSVGERVVGALLENGADYDLHAAVARGDKARVLELLENPSSLLAFPNHESLFIDGLMGAWAIDDEKIEVLQILFEHGLKVSRDKILDKARTKSAHTKKLLTELGDRYGV